MPPFRPFLLPQRRVSPPAPLPTRHSLPTIHYQLSCSAAHESQITNHKSRLFNRLPPLCRPQKSQLLCNQANPGSFTKTPGVGYPERICGTPRTGQPQDASFVSASPFRINTCKSVSKQTTLSSFRINTYEKHREGGGLQMPSIPPDAHSAFGASVAKLGREQQKRPRRSAAATFGEDGMGRRISACVAAPDFRGRFWVYGWRAKRPRRSAAATFEQRACAMGGASRRPAGSFAAIFRLENPETGIPQGAGIGSREPGSSKCTKRRRPASRCCAEYDRRIFSARELFLFSSRMALTSLV